MLSNRLVPCIFFAFFWGGGGTGIMIFEEKNARREVGEVMEWLEVSLVYVMGQNHIHYLLFFLPGMQN